VDAPVATLSGLPGGGSQFCFPFGSTTPFTPERLAELYPSRGALVSARTRATIASQRAGFLTRADARDLIVAAARSDIGAEP
jgi:hypothetical protein